VTVLGDVTGEIGRGLVLLLGVEKHDGAAEITKLANRVVNYRVFPDDAGHMNRSLLDVGGSLLVVSQFTLAADTRKGLRPSFSAAAPPAQAEQLYEAFLAEAAALCPVQAGRFGADMKVALVNDGPVTFMLTA